MSPLDAPDIIDLAQKQLDPAATADTALRQVYWPRWRGRLGLDAEGQKGLALAARSDAGSDLQAMAAQFRRDRKSGRPDGPLGDAIALPFLTHAGRPVEAKGYIGERLMDVAKRAELIEATCGGWRECATCHVHLRSGSDHPLPENVPEPTEEEQDQLEVCRR